jgi:hypothetical protein
VLTGFTKSQNQVALELEPGGLSGSGKLQLPRSPHRILVTLTAPRDGASGGVRVSLHVPERVRVVLRLVVGQCGKVANRDLRIWHGATENGP